MAPPAFPGGRRALGRTLSEEEKKNMPKITRALIKRVLSYLAPYKWHLAAVFLGIILSAVLGVVPSMLTGKMIDLGLYGRDFPLLIKLVIASFIVLIGSNLFGVLEVYISSWVAQHIGYDMKNQMYAHLQKMPQSFFTSNLQGDIITRMTSDINGVQSVVSGTMSNIFSNICTVAVTVVALFQKNWLLALFISILLLAMEITPRKWEMGFL